MLKTLNGKKLLILGAYRSEIEIVEEAKQLGVYTVVTDNHSDWKIAPAKYAADEAWDISWSDIDALAKKCEDEHIDGCLAGFSERRVGHAQELCKRLGLPFYADGARLDVIFDKELFKQECIKTGVVVPKIFRLGEDIIYPVIVKPVDNGGSQGISICRSKESLETAIERAKDCSDKHQVIIEQYIEADEVMIYFTVCDSKIKLSAMCDRQMRRFSGAATQLPTGYFFPSKHLNTFVDNDLKHYQDLIHNLGIRDGLIAFQALMKDGRAMPFDPTYRLDGTMAYHITENQNGSNALRMLILKSLTGEMNGQERVEETEKPFFAQSCCELPILLGKGRISEIKGLKELQANPNVIHIFQNHDIGDVMERDMGFAQMLCRIQLLGRSNDEIDNLIREVYKTLKVVDEQGRNMIVS